MLIEVLMEYDGERCFLRRQNCKNVTLHLVHFKKIYISSTSSLYENIKLLEIYFDSLELILYLVYDEKVVTQKGR